VNEIGHGGALLEPDQRMAEANPIWQPRPFRRSRILPVDVPRDGAQKLVCRPAGGSALLKILFDRTNYIVLDHGDSR
jgi:hypothetical protein